MSDRIVKHSSCYKGPAGDSRPAAEIFAGIEARAEEQKAAMAGFEDYLDGLLSAMPLTSHTGRVAAIKERFIAWWMEHDMDAKERYEEEKR